MRKQGRKIPARPRFKEDIIKNYEEFLRWIGPKIIIKKKAYKIMKDSFSHNRLGRKDVINSKLCLENR